MIRKGIILVLGILSFAAGFLAYWSFTGVLNMEAALLLAVLGGCLATHYLIRSFIVAVTLAGSLTSVLLHAMGMVSVANRVGFDAWTLTFEGVAGFTFAALIGIPFCVHRLGTARTLPADGCRQCGYNLTGNVSGVCPECGREIEVR
jgi:hypothetical protein